MEHGGKREGAGRKPGQLEPKTVEKIHVKKAFDERVMRHTDELFTAQFSLAVGLTYVYRVEETLLNNGKTKREHILVIDPEEIKRILDGSDGSGSAKNGKDFFIVATNAPDNRAIDSLLDRTFGKAQQSVEIKDENKGESGDIRIMLALHSIKTLIQNYGLTFEAAVLEYFTVTRPEYAELKDVVTQKLKSEMKLEIDTVQ